MGLGLTGTSSKFFGLQPVKIDKHGPMYLQSDIDHACMKMILAGVFFERRIKTMVADDTDRAIEKTEKMTHEFSEVLSRFVDMEKRVAEQSKRAAGAVRESADRLAQGLAKVEKAANFDRLDRLVALLERAAAAMTVLAELEESGKLERITTAMKD